MATTQSPSKRTVTLTLEAPARAAREIPVRIGRRLGPALARAVAGLKGVHRVGVVTDTHAVERGAASQMIEHLRRARLAPDLLVVPAGERHKTRRTSEQVEDKMVDLGFGRDSLLIALGGGVVSDLTGFVAATYQRGIPFLTCPTTLLGMVDAAVGGKTGVDTSRGKNLIGAFHHPLAIFMDLETLKTLPPRELRNGWAEVIKYAVIGDPDFFDRLEAAPAALLALQAGPLQDVVAHCVRRKAEVVQADEREGNRRLILNFGHTIGHALEKASAYKIPHGRAVAVGMAVEAKASNLMGFFPDEDLERLLDLMRAFQLSFRIRKGMDGVAILRAVQRDKKKRRGVARYALPRRIGEMLTDGEAFAVPVPERTIRKALDHFLPAGH